jgi:putative phosphoesterase
MKIIIFSDSHGSPYNMERALRMHKDAEAVFFLGDGLTDIDGIRLSDEARMWLAVKGNCDFRGIFMNAEAAKIEQITLEGRNIILTHGDMYDVKYGTEKIKSLAQSRKADIVLFGHTHQPYNEYVPGDRPFYLFNPGSIGNHPYSFGVLTLSEGAVLLSHGSLA